MLLPSLLSALPAANACSPPPPDRPPPVAADLLPGAPITPDGRAHVLTSDRETVCWWSVDEDGEAEVHRVWPIHGPHGVALAARTDGSVVVVLRSGRTWALLDVGPDGAERCFPIWGTVELVGVHMEADRAVLDWCDDTGGRLRSRVDVTDGSMDELARLTRPHGGPHGAQSRR